MSKLTIIAAGAVGYVLGARAGRDRYEQLRQAYEKVKNDPRVQEKAHQAADVVKEKAGPVAEQVKEKVAETAGAAATAAKEKVTGASAAEAEAAADGELNPDRLKLTEDTGPQGKLP